MTSENAAAAGISSSSSSSAAHPGSSSGSSSSSGCCISTASMRCLSEMCGLTNLSEEACQFACEQAEFRLRLLVQQAQKFARHSKRRRLAAADVACAMRQRRVDPTLGCDYYASLPVHTISAPGNRKLHFQESEEIDLVTMATQELPRVPVGLCLKAHWLSIDGCQPAILENPTPRVCSADAQQQQQQQQHAPGAAELAASSSGGSGGTAAAAAVRPKSLWELTMRSGGKQRRLNQQPDLVKFKDIGSHELSREQQMFYREISEACVSNEDRGRDEAMHCLATDSALHQILPRLIVFIYEGVRINLLSRNLALLIYLMRMVTSLLENPHLQLERFLHLLLPSILTCVLGKQLSPKPDSENHWALRDFAAKQLGNICRKFNSPTSQLCARVSRLLADYMQRPRPHLASLYGCMVSVIELGHDSVASILLPLLPRITQRLDVSLTDSDLVSAEHIKKMLNQRLPEHLCRARSVRDTVDDYIRDYASFGPDLFFAVQKLRSFNSSAMHHH